MEQGEPGVVDVDVVSGLRNRAGEWQIHVTGILGKLGRNPPEFKQKLLRLELDRLMAKLSALPNATNFYM